MSEYFQICIVDEQINRCDNYNAEYERLNHLSATRFNFARQVCGLVPPTEGKQHKHHGKAKLIFGGKYSVWGGIHSGSLRSEEYSGDDNEDDTAYFRQGEHLLGARSEANTDDIDCG